MEPTPLVDDVRSAALATAGLTKSFGAVRALRDVSLVFPAGQVTGLLGENGAGKSTLIRLCSGQMQPDAGRLTLDGREVSFANPLEAIAAGVVVVNQEPLLISELTIADNLFLYDLGERPGFALARRGANVHRARELLARLGMTGYLPDPSTLCRDLSAASRQMVDIVRALSRQPRVLFLDEPNSSLTHEESERLFAVMARLRDEGVAVVLVSHRLAEVYSIVDNVVVLRDGTFVAAGRPDEIDQKRAVALMAGEKKRAVVAEVVADRAGAIEQAEVALELRGLTGEGFTDVSFAVRRGEIVGMSGLVGAGRTEIAEAVIGLRRPTRGGISVAGRPVRISGPGRAQRLGLAYVAEERRTEVFHAQSVGYNLTVRVLSALSRLGWVSPRRTNAKARELTERFGVKAASSEAPITSLSGGNQQKVLLARALAARPKVLILDEPTRGVDVGTKAEIYATLRALAHDEGLAVWFISSELEEVVELADRVVVVRGGRVTLDALNNAGPQPIVAAAMGATEGST
ncbi:ABC transporter [Micromonospora sagamiensis]|uniref:Autoinducer 2 import ATP-binding protein LsrA n=1 Tax=Micromonospora sagamiensis TaxID=47875 RepID=A0A562WDP1_9ACTN|nr:ribose transport system ATP-binding protein/L-arabinose transport system ATP-binding protein [Micromonospora sagamiensis]BCL12709.1 ABC transporter [Micromonospora sagamiensis]